MLIDQLGREEFGTLMELHRAAWSLFNSYGHLEHNLNRLKEAVNGSEETYCKIMELTRKIDEGRLETDGGIDG